PDFAASSSALPAASGELNTLSEGLSDSLQPAREMIAVNSANRVVTANVDVFNNMALLQYWRLRPLLLICDPGHGRHPSHHPHPCWTNPARYQALTPIRHHYFRRKLTIRRPLPCRPNPMGRTSVRWCFASHF